MLQQHTYHTPQIRALSFCIRDVNKFNWTGDPSALSQKISALHLSMKAKEELLNPLNIISTTMNL